ncbi:two-component sensor histidine kinase [Bacillus canaveralius]|uniref:histidine kinase n=1 Tax=Bacillus canaveralius TaxID=1403243 RepID=A0A2N5GL47_9BACI|nr:HAMP domain-containing sensor histidine kinase [Bacillus canaveralius]PLR82244.1 two-component sensor histidine kinase [Bacillus canaveralius]PLR98053.1 two-component sensor histidine kinase [Bacillus canaveralius]
MTKFKSISFKLGLLFSGIFISLFLVLGFLLYGVFTNFFVDYIKQDLLARGNNHARILEDQFNKATINHVIEMERGVRSKVLVTDSEQKILASSAVPDQDMKQHIRNRDNNGAGRILESDWQQHKYIISVSPIGKSTGYVYMYYPVYILREIVMVMNALITIASIGIVLLAFGLIGILSRKLTKPLLTMKEATNEMASGKYKQKIAIKGNDEIAQLGNSIQKLGEQLQYYEDSRNDFLAAVSHELRTPLTYIKGYSDILNKEIIKSSEEKAEYLKIINKEAKRISFLVNDLFEMSKLQVGKFELNKEWANINTIIKKVISNLKPAAMKKDLVLNESIQTDLPAVHVDTQRMEQVLYNLIENGIKYTNHGGITVRSYVKKEFIVIEIKDTGIGIPQEDLAKIWERFYRVDQSRTRKTGGTGLGLYVVKQIIESHGGDITVKSTENEGSVFTIFLKK